MSHCPFCAFPGVIGWWVAYHPDFELAALRLKTPATLHAWRHREWDMFEQQQPIIADVTASTLHLIQLRESLSYREKARSYPALLVTDDTPSIVNVSVDAPPPLGRIYDLRGDGYGFCGGLSPNVILGEALAPFVGSEYRFRGNRRVVALPQVDVNRFQQQVARGVRWLVAFRPDWPTAVFRMHSADAVRGWWARRWTHFGGLTPIMLDVTAQILPLCAAIAATGAASRIGIRLDADGYELALRPMTPRPGPGWYDCTLTVDIRCLPIDPAARPAWTLRLLRGNDYFPPGQERDVDPLRSWSRSPGGPMIEDTPPKRILAL